MTLNRRDTLALMTASALIPPALAHGAEKLAQFAYLIEPWSGPYGGVPAFDKVAIKDFDPASDAAMAIQRAEIVAITANKDAPDFDNTILALEVSGMPLSRMATAYYVWDSNLSTPELQKISERITPKFAAFGDEISQNPELFSRIEAVYTKRETLELTSEQQRLLWLTYTGFVRSGAKLDAQGKKRVAAINQELATLFDKFGNNVLAEENTVIFITKFDLLGLPESFKAGLASTAKVMKKDGYAIKNTRSAVEPFLTFSERRDLREKIWRAFVNRGDNKNAHDNNAIIAKILKLRFERAQLLGYETHAHWRLEQSMAKNPDKAMALMQSVWGPAVARVFDEVGDMQELADTEKAGIKIEPWDYRFYAEKVRKVRYDLEENEIKPYMQLENLREAMFWAAGQIYGFSFEPVTDVPVYHDDVRVWKVMRQGKLIGLWYFDPYARDGKRSGAWMNAYQNQSRASGTEVITLVSNNSNFIKGEAGKPVLISWDDANTLFHEFGHAIHGLASDVTYASLSGTNVARDYVEFPSQLNEHWLSTPEVLSRFALHVDTGKPMPKALLDKIEKAAKFNQGFKTVEYLSAALIDMKLHLAGGGEIDADTFEREELMKLGMPKEIVMRHRTPQFNHVFSGDGYSAGYYSYLWSDTLTKDAYQAFEEAKGPYDKAVAQRLYDKVLSIGNTVDPAEAYRAFRGRDVDPAALMRDRGFASDS
jgi:peptidyl-dipeptidase Dcp